MYGNVSPNQNIHSIRIYMHNLYTHTAIYKQAHIHICILTPHHTHTYTYNTYTYISAMVLFQVALHYNVSHIYTQKIYTKLVRYKYVTLNTFYRHILLCFSE